MLLYEYRNMKKIRSLYEEKGKKEQCSSNLNEALLSHYFTPFFPATFELII